MNSTKNEREVTKILICNYNSDGCVGVGTLMEGWGVTRKPDMLSYLLSYI